MERSTARLFLLGRLVVGGYFLWSGFHNLTHAGSLAGFVASRGVPLAAPAVIVSGILLVVAGLSFLTGVLPRLGVAALMLFLVPVTMLMHAFWADSDPAARQSDLINFTKNCALAGSALMFLAIPEPWPLSLHVPRRRHAEARA
jgi:uncharacterized membrane protein YphA (DoxX/SURF4 family)